jgi:hypothetical protein
MATPYFRMNLRQLALDTIRPHANTLMESQVDRSFHSLVADFCERAGIGHPEAVEQGEPVEVDGIPCSVLHDPVAEPATLSIYTDFGARPDEREASAYVELLTRNYANIAGRGIGYAISPYTGHVFRVDHLALGTCTAEELATTMYDAAAEAQEWRQTRFLPHPADPHERMSRAAARSAQAPRGAA